MTKNSRIINKERSPRILMQAMVISEKFFASKRIVIPKATTNKLMIVERVVSFCLSMAPRVGHPSMIAKYPKNMHGDTI